MHLHTFRINDDITDGEVHTTLTLNLDHVTRAEPDPNIGSGTILTRVWLVGMDEPIRIEATWSRWLVILAERHELVDADYKARR